MKAGHHRVCLTRSKPDTETLFHPGEIEWNRPGNLMRLAIASGSTITRGLLASGTLQRYIQELSITEQFSSLEKRS
jgi:hypothetical protein